MTKDVLEKLAAGVMAARAERKAAQAALDAAAAADLAATNRLYEAAKEFRDEFGVENHRLCLDPGTSSELVEVNLGYVSSFDDRVAIMERIG